MGTLAPPPLRWRAGHRRLASWSVVDGRARIRRLKSKLVVRRLALLSNCRRHRIETARE
jgi:hypothetical protein